MRATRIRREGGFLLIEVLVTIFIVSFGLLGLAGFIYKSNQSQFEGYERTQALILVEDMVSRLRANGAVANCYGSATAINYGYGTSTLPTCSAGTLAQQQTAGADFQAWQDALLGASETSGGNVGGVREARGCIKVIASNTYLVSVAWQGVARTGSPADGSGCGTNQYGDEALRRVISTLVRIPQMS